MSANRVYFPNLNGVRFLAALVVTIHHIEMGKSLFDQPNVYNNSFVGGVFGQLGIILFFVLSGFLITYLLLEEHRRSQTIAIKDFYMRRILRIWPVYYLIVILSLFVFPHIQFLDIPECSEQMNDGFFLKSLTYLSFLPNLGYVVWEHIPYATQTWSVGVEEQFYLLWPLLMLWAIKKNKIMPMLLTVIGVYLVFKTIAVYNYQGDTTRDTAMRFWLFIDHFSIDCMSIGGIGAYLLFNKKEKILKVIFSRYMQVAVYITVAIVTLKGWVLPWYNKEWYALLFIVVILNLAANKKSIIKLEFKPLNYLGKISYGLYMYHNLVLIVVLKLFIVYELAEVGTLAGGALFYTASLGLTVLISAISYEYFEKWFLTIKSRFAKVQSGDKISEVLPASTAENKGITVNTQPQTV